MEHLGRAQALSPLDNRYWRANADRFEALSGYLSEDAGVQLAAQVEVALLRALVRHTTPEVATDELDATLAAAAANISAAEVAEEERKTDHNVRALVHVLQRAVPEQVRHLVHVGATSYDITDTAAALRYRGATREVVLPLLIDVERALIALSEREAASVQVGRTHGQYAVPITFGFAVAEYVARLGKSILRIEARAAEMCGKLAGAVGAYNATSLLVDDPQALEREVLGSLGLPASESSTQIVEPEYLLGLLLELNTAFGILAALADDLRHLQRSEIGEVRESFGDTQVGSSTMPQKRNPWNSEHVKSLWKEFSPRAMTFFMDQLSEHQRDLTNSASARFIPEFVAGLVAAAGRTLKVLQGLEVDRERMLERLRSGAADLVLAEAAYVLLASSGVADAHERIRRITQAQERNQSSLADEARGDEELWTALDRAVRRRFDCPAAELFGAPERYVGVAEDKARALASRYATQMDQLQQRLRDARGDAAAEANAAGSAATASVRASV